MTSAPQFPMAPVDEGVAGPAPPGHPNSVDGSLTGGVTDTEIGSDASGSTSRVFGPWSQHSRSEVVDDEALLQPAGSDS